MLIQNDIILDLQESGVKFLFRNTLINYFFIFRKYKDIRVIIYLNIIKS